MIDARRSAWERRTEWPLTALALAFLAAYAWPILDPRLPPAARVACQVVNVGAWAAFAADYLVRLSLSGDRRQFLRRHLFDLATVALPLLRPLRALRVFAAVNVLNRRAEVSLRGRVVAYVIGGAGLLSFVAALAVLDAERGRPGANITTFGDAMWWAVTTMTSVGYGDRYPVTGSGRAVATALMVSGIALLGAVTATFASWLIERVRGVEAAESATHARIAELTAEVRALRAALPVRESESTVD